VATPIEGKPQQGKRSGKLEAISEKYGDAAANDMQIILSFLENMLEIFDRYPP